MAALPEKHERGRPAARVAQPPEYFERIGHSDRDSRRFWIFVRPSHLAADQNLCQDQRLHLVLLVLCRRASARIFVAQALSNRASSDNLLHSDTSVDSRRRARSNEETEPVRSLRLESRIPERP